ncbi:MAG TPA: hypothetical protein VHI78_01905 [Bacteroidales bacterium]|jgi:hypothetical protein|nr:hypothetical protein [Bacteroidales bacterium]
MRKIQFLRTVLSIAFAILAFSAFGQIPVNYVEYDLADAAPDNVEYVTVNKEMLYIALPDPVYHPNFTSDGSLTANFTWDWQATLGAPTITEAVGAANRATITFPNAGNYTITVQENSPAAFGSCTGSLTTMNVTAVAVPTAQFSTADVLTGLCGNQLAAPINIAITEDVPNALAAYAFRVSETVDTIDALGNLLGNVSTNATFVDFALGAKVKTGTAGFTAATPDFDYDFNSSARNVQDGKRTRYTYTLTSAAGVTGNGIVSAISHKSDYTNAPASVTGYAWGAKTTVVYIVNPAPVTGPIYHIPNNFNY